MTHYLHQRPLHLSDARDDAAENAVQAWAAVTVLSRCNSGGRVSTGYLSLRISSRALRSTGRYPSRRDTIRRCRHP